jgi:hypothetical protein
MLPVPFTSVANTIEGEKTRSTIITLNKLILIFPTPPVMRLIQNGKINIVNV